MEKKNRKLTCDTVLLSKVRIHKIKKKKKAEHQRTDAFELWCWRRLLRDPWTARNAN